jgi:4-diphosphocytidyl-2-C-methyl-D-erythritol kinase
MRLRACSKINRSLLVLGLRPDGYHELKTVFQSLALHDTLHFEAARGGIVIECAAPGVPLDHRNLAWKAARLVWEAAGGQGDPAGRLRITKRVPSQGGLGGGSADGAAALVGWNRLWGAGLPAKRLGELAVGLGADVPFFLVGGTVLGLNRGDVLRPLDDLPPRWVVLVFPPFGVSTPAAFRWWDEDRAASAVRPSPFGQAVVGADAESRMSDAESGVECVNDLEPAVSRRHPELLDIRRHLERRGAECAAMTGSGSTMFGLFEEKTTATAAAAALGSAGWRTLVTKTATRSEATPC